MIPCNFSKILEKYLSRSSILEKLQAYNFSDFKNTYFKEYLSVATSKNAYKTLKKHLCADGKAKMKAEISLWTWADNKAYFKGFPENVPRFSYWEMFKVFVLQKAVTQCSCSIPVVKLFIFSTDAWQQYATVLKTPLLHRNFFKEFDHRYRAVISQNAFWWLEKYFWRTLANGCFSKRADKIGSFL